MRLFIAEKPELARAIADGLGGGKKNEKDGYHDCGDDYVTWCYGHMLRLFHPEEYDEKLAKWNLGDLPFAFIPWQKSPNDTCDENDERSKKFVEHRLHQLDNVLALIKKADSIVNAGDPDAEGQLLIDEILENAENKKPVKRVLINDNTPAVVKKSLANLRDNAEFAGLSAAAEARQVGDWIYGLNLTRLYTLIAQQAGYVGDPLTVGRVQTPILGLVVRRDREHAAHKLAFYYTVVGKFTLNNLAFPATYQVVDNDAKDDKGRLTDETQANAIAGEVSGKAAQIRETKTAEKQMPAPLPYNLLKLQTDAARLYKMKPDLVKDITQNLREKHHLITYNRSDCQYLSEEQHADAPEVLAAIAKTNPDLADAIGNADAKIKGRVFDSAKITAHHAIIPTISTAKFDNLSTDEQKIYTLIARAYIAQFYPPYRYEQTEVKLVVGDKLFRCLTHVPVASGWKSIFADDETDSDTKEKDDGASDDGDCNLSLKELCDGQAGQCVSAAATKSETKPKRLYTMATLLTDLTKVAQYIKDERIRKLLIDKDKGKAGEQGGIGTPATRDMIIKQLFIRGFIAEKGKNVVATDKGQEFYDALPDSAKYPDMTALWHEQQKEIEAGKRDTTAFIRELVKHIGEEAVRVKRDGLNLKIEFHACPECGKALHKIKGKNAAKGDFWGCSGYPECKNTLPDDDGKPGARRIPQPQPEDVPNCPDCGRPMRYVKTDNGEFFGCQGYRDEKNPCKKTLPAKNGKVDKDKPRAVASTTEFCLKCKKPLVRRPSAKKAGDFWWGCSSYPTCKETYFDKDGKPDFDGAKKNEGNDAKKEKAAPRKSKKN